MKALHSAPANMLLARYLGRLPFRCPSLARRSTAPWVVCSSRAAPARLLPLAPPVGVALAGWPRASASGAAAGWRCYAAAAQVQEQAAVAEAPAGATRAVVLEVGGMKCGGCSAAVKRILLQQPSVAGAAVNLLTETAVVQVPEPQGGGGVSNEQHSKAVALAAAEALTAKGFPAQLRTADTGVQGTADSLNEKKAGELKRSQRNLALAWALAGVCSMHHIGHMLHALGLHEYAHTGFMTALGAHEVSAVLGAAALLGPGRGLLVEGAEALVRGTPNMNSLIAVGAVTSFTAGALSALLPGFSVDPSFLEEPVMLLAFVLLGRSLEARARLSASADLTALAQLIPAKARMLLDPGAKPGAAKAAAAAAAAAPAVEEVLVPTSSVRAGDLVRVLPGDRVPVDGQVVEGRGSVDESMLTGEARLVPVAENDLVAGGTVVYEAPLIIRATCTGSSSTLAGIARLVSEAQSREAPVQRLADWVAGKFCYTVMGASAATFAFWSTVGSQWFPQALDAVSAVGREAPLLLAAKLAIDVLVVACPCALGLATPTAVLVASSAGAKRGLLLRGGDVLERLASVDTVVLDKTGTLTQGRPQLDSVSVEAPGVSASQVLRMAAAAEATTRHPLADAVLSAARAQGLDVPQPSSAFTEPGEGVRAVVDGAVVAVGRREWVLQQVGPAISPAAAATENGAGHAAADLASSSSSHIGDGSTAVGGSRWESSVDEEGAERSEVWVGWAGQGLAGRLQLRDALRPDAAPVVAALQKQGLRVMLLSGDRPEVVEALAREAGIPQADALSGVRPEQKATVVSELRASGAKVAMVGDGVNDAPALAAADVGIAMGGGTDAAGEASSLVLLGDRLGQVLEALSLGRATLGKIRQNLGWALFYNLVGIPLAAGALLPHYGIALDPSFAGGMMAFSSVAVVSNSLLLRGAATHLEGADIEGGSRKIAAAGAGGDAAESLPASRQQVQQGIV